MRGLKRTQAHGIGALIGVLALIASAGLLGSIYGGKDKTEKVVVTKHVTKVKAVEPPRLTIYVQNFDPGFVSDATVKADIPVWEKAANGAFRTVWQTPKVKLVFVPKGGHVPTGAEVMQFTSNGPVRGAAAYHTENAGRPAIVIYAGIDDAYGVSLSVAVTHELFERLADPMTVQINQGWPYPYITVNQGQFMEPYTIDIPPGQLFINEVCDAVEAYHYVLHDAQGRPVWISDWVTPNWFNDERHTGFDFDYMGVAQQPFTIMQGGYISIYVVDLIMSNGEPYTGWVSVTNFRKAADRAFYAAEKHGREISHGRVK